MRPFGLYIHIPFCDGKCRYCSFFSEKRGAAAMDAYTDDLCRILIQWSEQLHRTITTVYFGGGTPSLLGHERLITILNTVKRFFTVEENAQITLEANPTSAGDLDYHALLNAGFNRLSIGMQSADDHEAAILGRRHTAEDARNTVLAAQRAGFDNISVDVMLAIPEQTISSLERTLSFCASMNIQHISAYILKVEEGTPFWYERDQLRLCSDDQQAEFYEYAVHRLKELGYIQYEISNFARDGKVSLHNLLYWHDEEYLGVGPSAHSFIDGRRFYYPDSFDAFAQNRTAEEGSGGDEEEYIMLALRLNEGLIFERYRERFGDSLSQRFLSAAEKLSSSGYVQLNDRSVSLTLKGFLVSNSVIGYLLENT